MYAFLARAAPEGIGAPALAFGRALATQDLTEPEAHAH